jgi:hypothetical protein
VRGATTARQLRLHTRHAGHDSTTARSMAASLHNAVCLAEADTMQTHCIVQLYCLRARRQLRGNRRMQTHCIVYTHTAHSAMLHLYTIVCLLSLHNSVSSRGKVLDVEDTKLGR